MSFQRTACTPPASRIATDPAGLTARRVIARRAAPRRVLREREKEREREQQGREGEKYREVTERGRERTVNSEYSEPLDTREARDKTDKQTKDSTELKKHFTWKR